MRECLILDVRQLPNGPLLRRSGVSAIVGVHLGFCKEKLMTSALLQIRVEAFPLWLHLCSSPPQFGKFGKGHLDETTLLLRSCRNVHIHTVKVSENFWDYFYYLLQWCRSRVPSFPSVIGANEGKSGQTSHHPDISAKDTFCSHKNGLCIIPYNLLL